MKFTGTIKVLRRVTSTTGKTITFALAAEGTFTPSFKNQRRKITFIEGTDPHHGAPTIHRAEINSFIPVTDFPLKLFASWADKEKTIRTQTLRPA